MYSVPQYIDNSKVFLVQRSEIEGRLDPHYNMPEYSELYRVLDSLPCKLSTLKEESTAIFSGITPKSGGEAYTSEATGIPFVRSGDFTDTNLVDFSKLLYLKQDVHNGIMSASKLKKNDVLIAIVGATIGKIGIYRYDREANINQAICGIRLKDNVSSFFVQAFYQTSIGQKIIERTKRPVARANLNLEEIGRLPIPLLNEDIQRKVVDRLQTGIEQKQQKESEAQQLLDSIDSYILNELGIVLPMVENDLEHRIFVIPSSEVTGNRIDPKKYSLPVKTLYASIKQSKYDNYELSYFVTSTCSGDWGADDNSNIPDTHIRCLTLRAADFDNQYNLSMDSEKVKYRLIKKDKYEKMCISPNDIIIEKSGGSDDWPVGRVAFIESQYTDKATLAFSNFLLKISVSGILPSYLYFYLKTMYNIGVTDSMQSQTNGIRNLILDEYLSQTIVLPPMDKQLEISGHVYSIRQKAKQLQEEGKTILENAKKEVEQRIIG